MYDEKVSIILQVSGSFTTLICSSLWQITQLLTLSDGPHHTDEMAKYHFVDQDVLNPLH